MTCVSYERGTRMASSRDNGEVWRDNVTAGREYESDASGSASRRWNGEIGVKVGENKREKDVGCDIERYDEKK